MVVVAVSGFMWVWLLLIVAPGALSNRVGRLPGEQTRSVHEEHQRTSGGIRDTGYFRSPQLYSDAQFTSHGRRTSATSFSRMRLKIVYTETLAGLTTAQKTFFQDKLIPDAKAWIENAFSVVPISGPLLVDRFCSSSWSTVPPTCASVSPSTCGLNVDGTYYTIPDSMLAAKRTCGGSPTTGCTDHPAGAGAADTDFLLYVAAVQTSSCGSGDAGTLAYASTCERDQNDRPVLGYANFCPAMMDTSDAAYKGQLATAVHEIVHAIGYTSGSWPLFRNADGTPKTAREADGLPAMETVTCVDGSTRSQVAIDTNTLVMTTARGTTVNKLVTPRVVSVARDHFACATLDGVELKNQPTTAGACRGSHFEQRLYMNEMLAPVSGPYSVFSALTLAVMEDSGWFKTNYSVAEPLFWGRKQGCAFATEKCIVGGVPKAGFCTDSSPANGCSPDHKARGYCSLSTYTSALPAAYQYLTNPAQGGMLQQADYCPYYKGWSNGLCEDTANLPTQNVRGEVCGRATRSAHRSQRIQCTVCTTRRLLHRVRATGSCSPSSPRRRTR